MKRLLVPLVFLALLGGLAPSLRAESPCCKAKDCSVSADAKYTKELLDVLENTRSVDAFVVTLHLLADTDVDPRTALPVIVRHAERLGVFNDSLAQDQEEEDKAFTLVMEMIDKLQNRLRPAQANVVPPVGAAVGAGCCATTSSCEDCCRDKSKPIEATDHATPILPPLRAGAANACHCPPDDAEVLRALPRPCHVPGVCEASRDDVEVVTEEIVNKVDEPRFYPLVGIAQLHHCHWKCTVYYDETIEGGYPCCYQVKQPHVAVVYIDKDHLHLYKPEEKPTPNVFFFGPGFYR